MQRRTNLRQNRPNGVYYGGPTSDRPVITVEHFKNCLPTMPPLVRLTAAHPGRRPLTRNQPALVRQAVSVNGVRGIAFVVNQLVQDSFDAALELAIGALP